MSKAEDLFIEDCEYKKPALRGAFEKWVGRDWTYGPGTEASLVCDPDDNLRAHAFKDFEGWLNRQVDDHWFKDVKEEYGMEEPREIFYSYWESNEDFRKSVLSHTEGTDEWYERTGEEPDYDHDNQDKSDKDEEEEDQSSFGESRFPELFDLGVVTDTGGINRATLRGLAKAFVKDIDEILGETREFEPKWAQRAFLYWGTDRFGNEWIKFCAKHTADNAIYDAVSYIYTSDDEVAQMMEEKYRGNQTLEMGNPDTDDLTDAFLDSEVPGWDEDEEDDGDDEGTDRWGEFEERSKKENESKDRGDKEEQGSETKSKWDEFEEKSASLDTDTTDKDGKDTSNGDSETGGTAADNDTDGLDSPGNLKGWAEKQGKADEEQFRNDRGTKSGSGIDDYGESVQDGEPDSEGDSPGGTGGPDSDGRRSRGDVRDAQTEVVECEDGGRPYPIEWPEVGRIDELERNKIYEGNTFEWSMKLPENSVDTMVTSPPYYALRDYDIEDAFPISGDFTCEHDWQDEFCTKCGAFLGQLGHEPEPALFIDHIVDLMERYKKVLKPSGSLWLNIGDTYAGKDFDGRVKAGRKSRMMIPDRIYRRMVQTGWHLRDYVIWVKKAWMPDDDLRGNGKPFAGNSRLAAQWEPMVRFTPEPDHYSDVDSNRLLPPSFDGDLGSEGIEGKFRKGEDTQRGKTYNELGTNPPDVWLINSDGYDGDHRAVYPEELPKRCIKLTTPDRVCEVCGRPFDKEVHVEDGNKLSPGGDYSTYKRRCSHEQGHRPGVAFDPFLGSGTTGVAAANSGFDWAGVELSEKYVKLARDRIPTGRQVGLDQW